MYFTHNEFNYILKALGLEGSFAKAFGNEEVEPSLNKEVFLQIFGRCSKSCRLAPIQEFNFTESRNNEVQWNYHVCGLVLCG